MSNRIEHVVFTQAEEPFVIERVHTDEAADVADDIQRIGHDAWYDRLGPGTTADLTDRAIRTKFNPDSRMMVRRQQQRIAESDGVAAYWVARSIGDEAGTMLGFARAERYSPTKVVRGTRVQLRPDYPSLTDVEVVPRHDSLRNMTVRAALIDTALSDYSPVNKAALYSEHGSHAVNEWLRNTGFRRSDHAPRESLGSIDTITYLHFYTNALGAVRWKIRERYPAVAHRRVNADPSSF